MPILCHAAYRFRWAIQATIGPEEVPALGDRAPGRTREADLAVVIDGDDPHDCPAVAVAGEEHRPGDNPTWFGRVSKRRPAEAIVVPGVQVGNEIEFVVHGFSERGLKLRP
jgi:hypothetical protein